MCKNNVYEPNEDTWTLIDVVTSDIPVLENKVILELGCGSGEVTKSISENMTNSILITTDINWDALHVTKRRRLNCDMLLTPLLMNIEQNMVDVVIFNPPYVETENTEFKNIDASYSGGFKGREIIDEFIKQVEVDIIYLLVIRKNDPAEIMRNLAIKGYESEIKKIRKVVGETIVVIKAKKITKL